MWSSICDVYSPDAEIIECQRCKKKIRSYKSKELQLDGTDDIYTLELCEDCYEYMSSDYFSPEDVDNMFK
jgi:hypothetical protein